MRRSDALYRSTVLRVFWRQINVHTTKYVNWNEAAIRELLTIHAEAEIILQFSEMVSAHYTRHMKGHVSLRDLYGLCVNARTDSGKSLAVWMQQIWRSGNKCLCVKGALRLQPLLGKPLVTTLKAPPTGRQSDCIFNNKPVSSNMFLLLLNFLVFCSNSLGVIIIFFSLFFWWGERNALKDALNWSKVMINIFVMLQKISVSDRCCSSELFIHQRNLKKILFRCFQNNKCFLSSKSEYFV